MIARNDSAFENAFADYWAARLATAAQSTQKHYRMVAEQFQEFLQRAPLLSDLNDGTMGYFLAWLSKRVAPVTVNQRRHYMLAFWRWCFHHAYVTTWPEVRRVHEPERTPAGWHVPQIQALLVEAKKQQGTIATIPAGDYWQALFWFWFHGGERTGATFQIRYEGVDWSSGEIDAPGSIRKAGKAERHCMGERAMEAIRRIRYPERELLFPWPLHFTTLYNRLKRICKSAGLPYRPPKAWRISFASHLEANGGNATAALQHTSRAITIKSYLDPSIVKRERACDRLPEL